MARLATGVEGFDAMVQGGLPEGSSVVLQGPPGQEKLRFALTFLAEGLKAGASGLVVISSQSPDSVLAELRNLGVDLDAVTKENRLRVVDWYSWSEEAVQEVEDRGIVVRSSIDLTNLGVALSRAIASLGGGQPRRAVIELLSPAMNVYELTQVYAFAQSAKKKFDRYQFTSLILLEKEMHSGPEITTLHQPFDGAIEIERTRSGDRILRKIGVLHLKDTTPDPSFRILEMTESGMRVVREVSKPAPAVPPVPPVKGGVLESQEERARRLQLIMQIASERLKLNPKDADALFAMAAAQATLDDARGGLQTLGRLADLDPKYPGLWVLKTKLHARLGEADLARQARMRAQQSEPEEADAAGPTVPCPMCEAPVALDATSCQNCGVKFARTRSLEDELEDLGHAAIQEMVQEELGTGKAESAPPPPEPAKPMEKKPQVAPPPKPAVKPTPKKGLTNGLVLKRGAGRRTGMTNGLKGRTNGLRGRTNGLTNGLGRTNGLTNGVGRTNGLTNGLGHTNGLTNGMGRTNGLTNGLGRTNGITNGLGRTNGLTNGLGGMRPAGFRSSGFRGMMRSAGWKLYLIPLVVVVLLLVPLFVVPEYLGPSYPIRIDGQFDDWNGVPRFSVAGVAANPNIDITQVADTDNVDFISFYVEVRGLALQGGPSPARTMDAFFVFIDTDRFAGTGYRIQGLGADRMIEISGWGGQVVSATLFEFDASRDSRDWAGWFKGTAVAAAASGSRIEFEANWEAILQPKARIAAAFASRGWDGTQDLADTTITSASRFVLVRQQTAAPLLVTGGQTEIAQITLQAVGGDVEVTSINVTLRGSFGASTFASIALANGVNTISSATLSGDWALFDPVSIPVPSGSSVGLSVRPTVAVDDGTTVGVFIATVADVGTRGGGVAFVDPVAGPASLAYVGVVPAWLRIDGGFADWTNTTTDPTGDVVPKPSRDIDISRYGFGASGGDVYFMIQTVGSALNGTLLPAANRAYSGNFSSPADSDRDAVPDSVDPMPYDFNNDGTPDTSTSGDYDGDGVTDYGFPGGTDYWLNTTIPNSFPAPYAGRVTSVYIGPVARPVERGEDIARFYLDEDGLASSGYAVGGLGADYMLEVLGKGGQILAVTSYRFSGSNPGQWSWSPLGAATAAQDRSRFEAGFGGVAVTNASRAFFEVTGWGGAKDDAGATGPAPISSLSMLAAAASPIDTTPTDNGSVHSLDISGNEKWFFTSGTTNATGCTTTRAASTTVGTSATSTTLSTPQTICWATPTGQPNTAAGTWEMYLDVSVATYGTFVKSPSSNGGTNNWTISGTTGCNSETNEYQCVDDDPNDGNSTYIKSTDGTTIDSLYDFANWAQPPNPLVVVNVTVEASCFAASGPIDVRVIVKSGSTTIAGTTNPGCSATWKVWRDTWTTDPADGNPWTAADINALQIGVRDNDASTNEVRVSHVKVTTYFTPVYQVSIDKCTVADCSTTTNLYTSSGSTSYGDNVLFTTSLASQTMGASERIRFKVQLVDGGTITVRYNGPNPGTDDSRATVPIPEFSDVVVPIGASLLVAVFVQHSRKRREQVS